MQFGDWRYLKFTIRVHKNTLIGPSRQIISQMWQNHNGGIAPGPALIVTLVNLSSTTYKLQFAHRNAAVNAAGGSAKTFAQSEVLTKRRDADGALDNWHRFHLKMEPVWDTSGPRGLVLVWADDSSVSSLDFTEANAINYCAPAQPGQPADDAIRCPNSYHKFYWGLQPDTTMQDAFDMRIGTYRSAPMDYMTYWLDDIKLTSTQASL